MIRAVFLALLALVAVPAAARDRGPPAQRTGPITITGPGSTGDVSGMSVTAGSTTRALSAWFPLLAPLANPSFAGAVSAIEGLASSPTSSHAGLTYQVDGTTAAAILGPQQPPSYFTHESVRSVMVVKPDATAQTTSAFGGYVSNNSVRDATGIFTTCAQVADNGPCWGGNLTMIDAAANGTPTTGTGKRLIGLEINPSVTSPNTTVQGLSIIGSSISQPAYADGITVSHLEPIPGGLRRVRGWRVDG